MIDTSSHSIIVLQFEIFNVYTLCTINLIVHAHTHDDILAHAKIRQLI